jgi:hypothetical protein
MSAYNRGRRALTGMLAAAALLAAVPGSAQAHVTEQAGPLEVTLGWGDEPPLVGFENFVEVEVADGSGSPVGGPADSLEVEVSFGDRRLALPLEAGEVPGTFAAVIVPTRPGTYAFHLTGEVDGQEIDLESTCSEQSFECVGPASDAQFPVADPSLGEVAEGLAREGPRVDDAADTADGAKTIAIAAIVVAAFALGAAGAGILVRRKSG